MPLSEGDEDFGELAKQFRQLAEGFHRLAVVAFDSISSAGFKHWGDELIAQADALDLAKVKPEGGTDQV
jgi:hypothetical protein